MKKLTLFFASMLVILGSCEKGQVSVEKAEYDMAYLKHNTYITSNVKSGASDIPELVVIKNGFTQEELMGRVFCKQESFDLIAGQTINAGSVIISNDNGNLLVTFQSTDGWMIKEVHLYAGTFEMLPVNPSNVPVPGSFPIKEYFNPTVDMVTYEIPLESLPDCPYIAAHAVVIRDNQEETAWGKGDLSFESTLNINRWGWLIQDCPEKCEDEELVIALKSYVVNPDSYEAGNTDPLFWVVSNGTGTSENCLGIGFNKFKTNETEELNYNLIKWGNPDAVAGTIKVWITENEGVKYINVKVELNDPELALSKSYLYVGTEEGLENYYYKYKGKDCFMYYNWFFKENEMGDIHEFTIPISDINEK